MTVIGFDLGTTYSCVGVYRSMRIDNPVEIIRDSRGKEKIPSYVTFTDEGILVGAEAKDRAILNSENTVYDILTLIGRKYNDPIIQKRMKYWPFNVKSDDSSNPIIKVKLRRKKIQLYPEEIIAIILNYMKELAENYLNEKVSNVVITIPAYFGSCERQSIVNSCKIAGLNVTRFIPKSAAAAITFWENKKHVNTRMVLIIDFGGGSTEISLVNIHNDKIDNSTYKYKFDVKQISSDMKLSGENLDYNMFDYWYKRFGIKIKSDPKNPQNNIRSLIKLHKSYKDSKKLLTTATTAPVEYQSLKDSISRSIFEEINEDLFDSLQNQIESIFIKNKDDRNNITDIVLIGGSSRIPIIQSKIQDLFPEKTLSKINIDTSSAYGATLYAAAIKDGIFIFNDTLPNSIGFYKNSKTMISLYQKYTTFPAKKSLSIFVESLPNNTLKVFEEKKEDDYVIGEVSFDSNSTKVSQINIDCNVNEFGIYHIEVSEVSTNKKYILQPDKNSNISQDEIDRMIKKFQMLKDQNEDEYDDEKLHLLEEENENLKKENRKLIKAKKISEEENIILHKNVQQLEEKCLKYEKFISSLKEKPSEFTIFDFDEYTEESVIGKGATSEVKIVWKKEKYAMKELVSFDHDHQLMKRFLGEYEILFKLRHPCIIRAYGFNYGDKTHNPSIILSLEPKSLEEAIKNKELNEEEKNRIAVEIVFGMRYIHNHKIMHRDLKPANILLSENNHVRITDFGLAKEEDLSISQSKGVGTIRFMAPELFEQNDDDNDKKNSKYTSKVDVYSFGVILIFIVDEKYPAFNLINACNGVLPRLPEKISIWTRELIYNCLSLNPENRPSFAEIIDIMKENNFDLFSDSKNKKLTAKQRKMKDIIERRILEIEAFEFQQQ